MSLASARNARVASVTQVTSALSLRTYDNVKVMYSSPGTVMISRWAPEKDPKYPMARNSSRIQRKSFMTSVFTLSRRAKLLTKCPQIAWSQRLNAFAQASSWCSTKWRNRGRETLSVSGQSLDTETVGETRSLMRLQMNPPPRKNIMKKD